MRRKIHPNASRAFSLIEVLLAIGIATLIMLALVGMLLGYVNSFNTQQTKVDVALSASRLVSAVETAVLQASDVLASHTFGGQVYSSSSTALVLELPSIDASGNTLSGKSDYIAFVVTGTTVSRIVSADASSVRISDTRVLTTALETISFTYYGSVNPADATSVKVDVRTQAPVKQQLVESHATQQIYLRNK